MCGVIAARSPHQKDNFALPHAQALHPELAVALAIIFHGNHRLIENGFESSLVKPVLFDVLAPLCFVPRDHRQNVYAIWWLVKRGCAGRLCAEPAPLEGTPPSASRCAPMLSGDAPTIGAANEAHARNM